MMPLDKAALLFLHQRWMSKRIAWLQIRQCRIPLQALQAMSLSDKKKFGIPDNHGGQTDHPLVLGDRLVSFHSRNLSQKIPPKNECNTMSTETKHRHFYVQTMLHTEAFTHRRFYTQTLLHTDAFTHGPSYTQKPLHTDAFTHRSFYTQTLSHTCVKASLCKSSCV